MSVDEAPAATAHERRADPAAQPLAEGNLPADQRPPAEPPGAEPSASEVPPAPQRPTLGAPPGPIEPGDAFSTAGRKAMWPHVERLITREALLADPRQVDALKRYRVATRRLRAALRVFREAFPGKATRPIRRGLGELGDAVGAVRDLDVRIGGLADWAAAQEPDLSAAVEPMRAAWSAQRAAGSEALLHHLATRRHARLREDLIEFVTDDADGPDAAADESPARTIRDRAGSETWAAFEHVRAYATIVRWADLPTLHQLRIEAKRLRYTLEFLSPLLGAERERLVAQLVALQDHLGALNDASIAADATRAYLSEHHAALAADERAAIERYLADRERSVRLLRRGLGRFWRPIASPTFARRLAQAAAGPRPVTRRRVRKPAAT